MDRNTNPSSSRRNTNPSKERGEMEYFKYGKEKPANPHSSSQEKGKSANPHSSSQEKGKPANPHSSSQEKEGIYSSSKKESISSTRRRRRNNRDRPEERNSPDRKLERENDNEADKSIYGRNGETDDGRVFTYGERIGKSVNESGHSTSNKVFISTECKSISPDNDRVNKSGIRSESQNRRYDRIRVKEDEETERKLYDELSSSLSIIRRNRWNVGKWGDHPEGKRRGAQYHYTIWRNAYDSYLWEIFNRVKYRINRLKNFSNVELDFEDFVDFAYEFSSGYITPYA